MVTPVETSNPNSNIESCPKCLKRTELCFCADVKPMKNRIEILILQHPQEPDHELGTANLTHLSLAKSELRVGLSWRNLSAALGREAQPSRWAVLYLGSGSKGEKRPDPGLQFLSKKGMPVIRPSGIQGLVVLDGTWSQAKALWWRNAWLLKLNRVILKPRHPSLYGALRKEPRKECISTIESVAETLSELGDSIEISNQLRKNFSILLEKYKAFKKSAKR